MDTINNFAEGLFFYAMEMLLVILIWNILAPLFAVPLFLLSIKTYFKLAHKNNWIKGPPKISHLLKAMVIPSILLFVFFTLMSFMDILSFGIYLSILSILSSYEHNQNWEIIGKATFNRGLKNYILILLIFFIISIAGILVIPEVFFFAIFFNSLLLNIMLSGLGYFFLKWRSQSKAVMPDNAE